MTIRVLPPMSRRRFLATAAASTAVTPLGGLAAPYLSRAADRPAISHGVQSGDVSLDSGVVWARADRPARLTFDIATSDSFKTSAALGDARCAARERLCREGADRRLARGPGHLLPRAQSLDLAHSTVAGEPIGGRFRTAPADRRSISFVWSGDTAGQGWGIDEARGGMAIYETMRKLRPDFFIHCGDTIYADGPIEAEKKMPDGGVWKNLTHRRKAEGRRDARRVPRQLQVQSARQEPARLQCRSADAGAMGRPRGHQQLVALEVADGGQAL